MFSKFKGKQRPRRAGDSGFTLIELLVVVVILGVLAAVVVFSVSGFRQEAGTNACASEIRTIGTAIETYYAEFGTWPASLGDLVGAGYIRSVSFSGTYTYDNTNGDLTMVTCPDP